jgi:cytochrome c peroxidase
MKRRYLLADRPAPRAPRWARLTTSCLLIVALSATFRAVWLHEYGWTPAQRAQLAGMAIGALGPARPDPTNRFADDTRAARLGARWFRETRFSANGKVACRSCHDPTHAFSDGKAFGEGIRKTKRNTPQIVGVSESPWFFWDGRRDSLWAQALTPLESSAEHGSTRTHIAHQVALHYRTDYEDVFGSLPPLSEPSRFPSSAGPLGTAEERQRWLRMAEPDRALVNRVFANVGKAVAAYERTLSFSSSRFDRFAVALGAGADAAANQLLDERERNGLRLFVGKAKCVTCHSGPLFTSNNFFSVGVPDSASGEDMGRGRAFAELVQDPFNCVGAYSDGKAENCDELRYLAPDSIEFLATFKVPSLRNVAETAPYLHAAQFASLDDVLAHYDAAPRPTPPRHTDVLPLHLNAGERADLVSFLHALSSDVRDPLGEILDAVPQTLSR